MVTVRTVLGFFLASTLAVLFARAADDTPRASDSCARAPRDNRPPR